MCVEEKKQEGKKKKEKKRIKMILEGEIEDRENTM